MTGGNGKAIVTNVELILSNLRESLGARADRVNTPFLYLDQDAVLHLFQTLTGLSKPPSVKPIIPEKDETVSPAGLVIETGQGMEPPAQALFEAMAPVIVRDVPMISGPEDVEGLEHQYARVKGLMQSTRFPDGDLNLEIGFGDLRGILFYTPSFFSSMMRPLLAEDRFHTIYAEVEALVYVHGDVKRTIFYHLTYGDNQEHDWLPMTPVAVKKVFSE